MRRTAPTGTQATPVAKEAAPKTRTAALETALQALAESKKPALNASPEGAAAPADGPRLLPRGSVLDIKV